MPTDWAAQVRNAITNLEIKTDRVLEPDKALAIIDDVVAGKFAVAELAMVHGIPEQWIRTTLINWSYSVFSLEIGTRSKF